MKRVMVAVLLTVLLVGAPVVGAQDISTGADLTIEQPHYIDSEVSVDRSTGVPVYQASGGELLLTLDNANSSDVVEFGIVEDAGDLSRDEDLGVYRFTPSTDATFTLFWVVEEERVEGNETVMKDVRYEARVQVSKTSMQHVPAGSIDEIQRDAESWRNFKATVLSSGVAGANADIEKQTEVAISMLRLRHHPLEALTGQFTGLLVTLFVTLSGLVLVSMAVGGHIWSRRKDIVEQRRQRQLDAERADLEDELDAMEAYERQSKLEGLDWNDIFPDDVARQFRDNLGETVLDGWLKVQPALDPEHILHDRLVAMQNTHVAVPTAETDGGSPEGSASYRLYPKGEEPETVPADSVEELADPSDEVLRGVALDDDELQQFDLPAHADTDLDVEKGVDELVSEMDIDLRRDFDDDPEALAQYMTEFLQTVVDHEFTDRDGKVRPVRHALNLWLRALRHVGEREGVPTARYQAEHVEMLLETYDREEEIANWVDQVELGQA